MRNWTAVFLMLFLVSCVAEHESSATQNLSELCEKIQEIKILPFKGEPVEDEVYNEMIEAGDSIVPCLIDKMTDTTLMADPRQSVHFGGTRVGDVAFWVILRITGEDLRCFLPEDVRAKWKDQGIYAYFGFIKDPKNRKVLQENVRQLFDERSSYQKEGKTWEPIKCVTWEWPDDIRIKEFIESREESGGYIAIIEVDKKAQFVKEGERFGGLEVMLVDAVNKCLVLRAVELDEERELCLSKEKT